MKKPLRILFLILGGSLAAGVFFVLFFPVSPRSLPVPPPASVTPSVRAVLLLGSSPASSEERASRSEFGFGEKVYATAVFDRVESGDHVLAFRWFNPRGGLQETFRRSFSSPGGEYRAWSWLELRGEEWLGFPLGPLGPGRFLGRWRIEVELDGKIISRDRFTVR